MKTALQTVVSIGLTLILMRTIAFAISGGPFPPSKNVVGTYAGVLTPAPSPASIPPDCAANSIGVFSVGVPSTSLATGSFVMFAQGRVFTGTIQGTADPGKATLKGVLNSTFNFSVTFPPTPCPVVTPAVSCTPSGFTESITASANGKLDTRIVNRTTSFFNNTNGVRLRGTATLDVSHGFVDAGTLEPIVNCEMTLKVSGFKQSSSAPNTVIPTSSP